MGRPDYRWLYYFLARHEEKLLDGKFGTAYTDYKNSVRMWIPHPATLLRILTGK